MSETMAIAGSLIAEYIDNGFFLCALSLALAMKSFNVRE
jgi:hypothetical protein